MAHRLRPSANGKARTIGEDAYTHYRRGYDLHIKGGHVAEAEAAYRQAIAAGAETAWVHLAVLLRTQRGREDDELAALRAGMAVRDKRLAARAALDLGMLLDRHDDREGARECFLFAEQQGEPRESFLASSRLGLLLAREGDMEGARDRMSSYAIWYGNSTGADLEGGLAEGVATLMATLAGSRLTRGPFRSSQVAIFDVRRIVSGVVASSSPLTAISSRVGSLVRAFDQRLTDRFGRDFSE